MLVGLCATLLWLHSLKAKEMHQKSDFPNFMVVQKFQNG
jgi:hypothetical protein